MTIHVDDHALPWAVKADAITATDMTLSRIETVMNLLLLASLSASSIRAATSSDHDRLHAGLLSAALDEALTEQRILWLELASTMSSGMHEPHRYCDVTRPDERQRGRNTRSKR